MHGYGARGELGKKRADPGSTRWVYNTFLRTQTKLRWVCGLCNVWCKDENGFKCHLQHETHIRNSEMARERPATVFDVTDSDEEFAQRFLRFLALNYMNQRVLLHDVYREMYPRDLQKRLVKNTCWGALGVFINAMSRAGLCEACRETKGWVVRVSQDMLHEEQAAEHASEEQQGSNDCSDSAAVFAGDEHQEAHPSEVPIPISITKRMHGSWEKVKSGQIAMQRKLEPKDMGENHAAKMARLAANGARKVADNGDGDTLARGTKRQSSELVTFQLQASKAGDARKQTEKKDTNGQEGLGDSKVEAMPKQLRLWSGLVVKVLCPFALEGRACGRKALMLPSGEVYMLPPPSSSSKAAASVEAFRVVQSQLQTVLPKIGGRVRILQEGTHCGQEGNLRSLETDKYSCSVSLSNGGAVVRDLPYDEVCKVWDGKLQCSPATIAD